jgi:hypothetical protein
MMSSTAVMLKDRATAIAELARLHGAREGRPCRLRDVACVVRYLAAIQTGASSRAAMRVSGLSAAAVRGWLQAAERPGAPEYLRVFRDTLQEVRPVVTVMGFSASQPRPQVVTMPRSRTTAGAVSLPGPRVATRDPSSVPACGPPSSPAAASGACEPQPCREQVCNRSQLLRLTWAIQGGLNDARRQPAPDAAVIAQIHQAANHLIALLSTQLNNAQARYDGYRVTPRLDGYDQAVSAATAVREARRDLDRVFAAIAPERTDPHDVRQQFFARWMETSRRGMPPDRLLDERKAEMSHLAAELRAETAHHAS